MCKVDRGPAHSLILCRSQFPASSLHNRYILVRAAVATKREISRTGSLSFLQRPPCLTLCQVQPGDEGHNNHLYTAAVCACCRCGRARAMQKIKTWPSPTQVGNAHLERGRAKGWCRETAAATHPLDTPLRNWSHVCHISSFVAPTYGTLARATPHENTSATHTIVLCYEAPTPHPDHPPPHPATYNPPRPTHFPPPSLEDVKDGGPVGARQGAGGAECHAGAPRPQRVRGLVMLVRYQAPLPEACLWSTCCEDAAAGRLAVWGAISSCVQRRASARRALGPSRLFARPQLGGWVPVSTDPGPWRASHARCTRRIWPSITQNSYQTGEVIAALSGIGRSRLVPEYSFLDLRWGWGPAALPGTRLCSLWQLQGVRRPYDRGHLCHPSHALITRVDGPLGGIWADIAVRHVMAPNAPRSQAGRMVAFCCKHAASLRV